MNELALFAGSGAGLLGSKLIGWNTVCAVEIDRFCRRVLIQRQRERYLSRFPIWDDIKTFDGKQWRGHVDVISGGFPCQDISVAGKGEGLSGSRSGLWFEMHRIIREAEPGFIFVENVAALTNRGLDRVLWDLAELGFDARWGVFRASHSGLPHDRKRIFILGYHPYRTDAYRKQRPRNTNITHRQCNQKSGKDWDTGLGELGPMHGVLRINSYAEISRAVHEHPEWVEQLRAIGNSQIPTMVQLAWRTLYVG